MTQYTINGRDVSEREYLNTALPLFIADRDKFRDQVERVEDVLMEYQDRKDGRRLYAAVVGALRGES